jgi:hypothetical protein
MAKLFAPKCAMAAHTNCVNRVGYHKKYKKQNGVYGYKWKNFCEEHRTTMKAAADAMKMTSGCANQDGRLGYVCTSTIRSPEQLTIDHIDGNRYNNSPSNQQVLCSNCHNYKTRINGDHLNSYDLQVKLPETLFEVA